jgi:uncharacterized protein (DUF1778 family)
MAKQAAKRESKWNFRVADDDDALVRAASSLSGGTLSAFVREAATSEARRVLADRTVFELDESAWAAFSGLLDREPQVPDGLRDLFSKPSVFE